MLFFSELIPFLWDKACINCYDLYYSILNILILYRKCPKDTYSDKYCNVGLESSITGELFKIP